MINQRQLNILLVLVFDDDFVRGCGRGGTGAERGILMKRWVWEDSGINKATNCSEWTGVRTFK